MVGLFEAPERVILPRECPFCGSYAHSVVGKMALATLLESNPGYTKSWFLDEGLSADHLFYFVRCNNCAFVYARDKLKDNARFRYYNEAIDLEKSQAKILKKAKRAHSLEIWSALCNLCGLDRGIKVLDFGSGWGDFLSVARCYGVEVRGLEYDQRKISYAQAFGIPCGDLKFVKNEGPYDLFVCNQVLEHVDRPRESLAQLRGMLKTGAIGYISVPNFENARLTKELVALAAGNLPSKDLDPLGHVSYFNPKTLRDMVSSEGYVEIPRSRLIPSNRSRRFDLGFTRWLRSRRMSDTSIFVSVR